MQAPKERLGRCCAGSLNKQPRSCSLLCNGGLGQLPAAQRVLGLAEQVMGLAGPPPPPPPPPPHTACPVLQDGHAYIGDSYDNVAILFSDIVGFSTMASTMSAVEVFLLLTK